MKKLKLIFGLLMLTAFVATTVLSYSSTDDTAVRKNVKLPKNAQLNSINRIYIPQ